MRDTAVIRNKGRTTQRLRLALSRGVTAANSGSAYQSVPTQCSGVSCWVSGLPATVTLAPHADRTLAFRVRVPDHVQEGQYLTGITAESTDRSDPVRLGSKGAASTRAIIVRQVTVGVAVTVGALARLETALMIPAVAGGWMGKLPRLNISVRNVGQTFATAKGTASCDVKGRRHSYNVVMHTVLPSTDAMLPINARGVTSGSWPCRVRLRDGAGHVVTWSGLVRFPELRHQRVYHTGKGTYTSVPDETIPLWAIVLMALGGLILAALLTLLVRNRRQRRRVSRPSVRDG